MFGYIKAEVLVYVQIIQNEKKAFQKEASF